MGQLAMKRSIFAQDLMQGVIAPVEANREKSKVMVAEIVATSTAIQKEFASLRVQVPRLKKVYEAKCKELDLAREELALPMVRRSTTQTARAIVGPAGADWARACAEVWVAPAEHGRHQGQQERKADHQGEQAHEGDGAGERGVPRRRGAPGTAPPHVGRGHDAGR